jgi:YHS domain-containing protein
MSLAGLATEYLLSAVGIAPSASTADHGMVGRDVFGWNYTTALDVVALAGFAVLYRLYRDRDRYGAGAAYAKDPVCGMQVERANAPARATAGDGSAVYFCSDHCRERFAAGARAAS